MPAHRLLAAGIPPIIFGLLLLVTCAWITPPSLGVFLVSSALAGAGIGAMIRGCVTIVVSTSNPDARAGAVATLFIAGYVGVSIPVIGVGLVLQHLSPRATLLIFALAVGLGILATAGILVRRPEDHAQPPRQATHPMTVLCRCFGAGLGDARLEPVHEPHVERPALETAAEN